MSLFDHLVELRRRLTRAVIALVIGAVAGYFVFPYLLDLIMAPYCAVVDDVRPDCS
jgi:sec-independent protein translocase protein TatC